MTFENRYCLEPADPRNAFRLFAGSWKYDFDQLSDEQIDEVVRRDGRPSFCRQAFGDLASMRILETGPGDGYLSAGLEQCGARDIVSIEAGSEAFLRCLIVKNYLGLQTRYFYGDFVHHVANTNERYDLVFAAGVLYHLIDPVDFIRQCARISPRLFLWAFYYDEEKISAHRYESAWFRKAERMRVLVSGSEFEYHERVYEPAMVQSSRYTGGLFGVAHWLTRADLLRALEVHGYDVLMTVEDEHAGVPAVNICARLRGID